MASPETVPTFSTKAAREKIQAAHMNTVQDEIKAWARITVGPTWKNPKSDAYGATGDGTTNDWPAFSTLWTELSAAGGGRVFLPAGTYRWNTTASVPNNVTIEGQGPEKTIIKAGGASFSGSGAVLLLNGTSNARLRGFTIDVDAANTPTLTYAFATVGATHIVFEDFLIKNFGNATRAMSLHGSGSSTPSRHITLRNFHLKDAHDTAIHGIAVGSSGDGTSGVEYLLIENGKIDMSAAGVVTTSQTGRGLALAMSPPTYTALARVPAYIVVRNVEFTGCKGQAVLVSGAIADVAIENCSSTGLRTGAAGETTGDFLADNYPIPGSSSWAAGTQPTYSTDIRFTDLTAIGGQGFGFGHVNYQLGYGPLMTRCLAYGKATFGYSLASLLSILTDCIAEGNGSDGLFMGGPSSSAESSAILTNFISRLNGGRGMTIAQHSRNVRIFSGAFNSNTTRGIYSLGKQVRMVAPVVENNGNIGIDIDGASGADKGDAQIIAPTIRNNAVSFGLSFSANTQESMVLGGTYSGNGGSNAISNAGGAKIRELIGYVQRNHGATSVADGGTIAHGLATTPTRVTVTPSVAGEFVSVTALGATTFTVAVRKHDGTAGTTQTVYWEAEV